MIIRNAKHSDINELKAIWKERFCDEDSFIEWYFENRFKPLHCSICEIDNKIISCLYSYPMDLKIRENLVHGVMIGGVSTLPAYEGFGYMKKNFISHLKNMRDNGYIFSILKAVSPEIYFSLEHRQISNIKMLYLNNSSGGFENVHEINVSEYLLQLYECYLNVANNFSIYLLRSFEEYKIKCDEYLRTGYKCIAYINENRICGYCFYYIDYNVFTGDECIAEDDTSYDNLFNYIRTLPYSTYKLKVDASINVPSNCNEETSHGNSMYGLNISELLGGTGLDGYAIEVVDAVIEENSGIFALNGNRIDSTPSLSISNGFLMQWLMGYKTIADLVKEGNAVLLNDDEIVEYMDSITSNGILILDEY